MIGNSNRIKTEVMLLIIVIFSSFRLLQLLPPFLSTRRNPGIAPEPKAEINGVFVDAYVTTLLQLF